MCRIYFFILFLPLATHVSAVTNYVWQGSPAPVAPYASWKTAAHTIQDAVDAADPGNLVLVTNGVYAAGSMVTPGYRVRNRLVVDKTVTVQSVSGPAVTVISGKAHSESEANGSNAVRAVYLGPGAGLAGFTVSNGHTDSSSTVQYNNSGGGVLLLPESYISNCVLTGNTAARYGGGVYCMNGGKIYNCKIFGNDAYSYGGGIYFNRGGTGTFCIVRYNSSGTRGGGVYCYYGGMLRHSRITENTSRDGAGGYCYRGGIIHNSVISLNSASDDGGGLGCDEGGLIQQCTVHGNYARDNGGGLYCDDRATIQNTVIYYNTARDTGDNNYILGNNVSYSFCCTIPVAGLPGGTGCIEDEPVLAGMADPHILPGSPCIDAGTNVAFAMTDIDGDLRIVDSRMDIGCDEVTNLTGSIVTDIISTNTTVSVHQPAQFTSGISGKAAEYIWTIETENVPIMFTNSIIVSNIWTEPGYYDVTLEAYNLSTSSMAVISVYVYSLEEKTVYVAPGGSHTWPFSTWITAATNIQSAIAVTQDDYTVVVTNGVYTAGGGVTPGYTLSNRVMLTGAVTVRSVNGPTATVITGSPDPATGGSGRYAVRCAYLSGGAVLSGLTLSNGYTYDEGTYIYDSSGGGVLLNNGGVVTNCIIVGNVSARDGGGAACNNGGTIIGSRISGNTAQDNGGGVMCVIAGTLEHCTITENRSMSYSGGGVYCNQGGIVRDCIIKGNEAIAHSGGGAYCFFGGTIRGGVIISNTAARIGGGVMCVNGGLLENCTITGNTAAENGGGVYTYFGGTARNCIIYFNSTGKEGSNWFNTGEGSTYEYSCTTPINSLPEGIGCINNDPQFEDKTATNFYLLESSPCVNAGTNMPWMYGALDIAGTPRIKEGRVDMGAYEFIPEPAGGLFILVVFLLFLNKHPKIAPYIL